MIAAISDAGLKGLGGAGFPAGRKWQIVRGFPAPRFMTVNADEGEPGTFKDRHHLERDPHRFLEGCLIAAEAVAAERIVIYLRDEYAGVRLLLQREIAALEVAGLARPGLIDLRRGAGAYVCGEESGACSKAIEGKRGLPRPEAALSQPSTGLFGRPTLDQQCRDAVLGCRDIAEQGRRLVAVRHGLQRRQGAAVSCSVSGRVQHPGVVAGAGRHHRERNLSPGRGGMAEGHRLEGLSARRRVGRHPAGVAWRDLPLDFGTLEKYGCFIGSAAR